MDADAEVIRRCLGGDREAFARLVERYGQSLYRLCYGLLGHPEEAADAVQESFARAYQALGRFDCTRPFAPWLYRISANYCRDRLRRRRRGLTSLDSVAEVADSGPGPAESVGQRDEAARIRAAVAGLPDGYRELVVMAHLQQVPLSEIAAAYDLTLTVVKNRLFRARQMLRKRLEHPTAKSDKLGDVCREV